jgi:hypothetical protein
MPFTGYQDFNPDFGSALARMIAANPGLSVNSGYRSPEEQKVLWEKALVKYGSPEAARKWVAPPGNSYHNKRLAADLGYASPEARKWAHEHAAEFGLAFPLGNEDWHVELASARGGGGAQPTGGSGTTIASAFAPGTEGEPGYLELLGKEAGGFDFGVKSASSGKDDLPKLIRGQEQPLPAPLESRPAAPQQTAAPPQALPGALPLTPLGQLFKVAQIGQPKKPPLRGDGRTPLPTIGYG